MRRAAAAAILGAVILLAGLLGHGSDDGSAQAAVKRAAITAADAESSRFTMSWTAPKSPAFSWPDQTIVGVMDYVHHRGRISYWADNEVLYDGDVVYMKWPVPWRATAPWLRFDNQSREDDLLDLHERAMNNPIGLLEFLSGASRDTREAGEELVRGTPTTQYEGTLDLQLVVDEAPAGERAELQDWLNLIARDGPTTIPFGLWVDRGGVTHRLRIDGPETSVTIEYFDFGVPVEITPPLAGETIGPEEFFKELTQHADDQTCSGGEVDEHDVTSESDSTSDTTARTSHFGGTDVMTDTDSASIQVCIQSERVE